MLLRARLAVSGRLTAGLENCLRRLLCTSAARAAVCSSVRRERSVFPLTGFRASESGIDCRILTVITVNAAFVFVATRPATMVLDIRTARIFVEVVDAC